jgi:methionine synthase II (cobalamin-independent)
LGYARESRISYQDFCAARASGLLPKQAKFQVSLPTPMAVSYSYCRERDVLAIYDAYERDMLREVAVLCAAIPHADLCLQWDVCQETLLWDGQPFDMYPRLGAAPDDIIRRLRKICGAVPADVDLGMHLCYGDFRAQHFLQPRDTGKMVELANALFAELPRPLSYIHMPVPIERTDEAYFAPLRELKRPAGTGLYLGVVHAADGIGGTRQRIAVANRHVDDFGIATECGIARARSPQLVRTLLELHALASREPPVAAEPG